MWKKATSSWGAFVFFAIGVIACSKVIGLDDLTVVDCLDCGDGGLRDAQGNSDSSTGGDAATCPAGRGPTMAQIGAFCIDTTEVTTAQYTPFLDTVTANPALAVQPADVCSWNTDFHPDSSYANGDPNNPIRGVDWCDAYAFCHWANKRLCGAVGGGPSPYSGFTQPTDQWYFACSSNGQNAYTYGDTFDSKICNGDGTANTSANVSHVAQFTRCHPPASPFSPIYDMTGNVLEWEDACESSAVNSKCLTRGGWFRSPEPAALACNKNGVRERNDASQGVGIRCCSP